MLTHPPLTLLRPNPALARRGLQVLLGGPETAPNQPLRGKPLDIQQKVDSFLTYANTIQLDITRQVLAFPPSPPPPMPPSNPSLSPILSTCLWVPSPGRTAMLFAPNQSEFPESAAPTTAAIIAALEDARDAGVQLVQVMIEPADAAGKTVFSAAGLTQLATLTYMERKPPITPPSPSTYELPPGYSLQPYSAQSHPLFSQAILDSYEQTLDCPSLTGVRDVEDIILGHKAVGPFDPQLWSVLLRYHKPVGVLLLSELPARHALELVYLGLAPNARGQGLGRLLMHRLLAIASRRHFEAGTLAVDAANTPAAHLYRRCGYTSTAQRVALIHRL